MICIKLWYYVKDVGFLNLGFFKISDFGFLLFIIFILIVIMCLVELYLLGEDEYEYVIRLFFRCMILRFCRVCFWVCKLYDKKIYKK